MSHRKGAYRPEFRQRMVESALFRRKPRELAREFGCHYTSISALIRQAKVLPTLRDNRP
jgi:transposase